MIADIFNNCLTVAPMLDNLAALSPSLVAVRFGHREITRCLKRVYSWIALFNAKNNLWWALFGELRLAWFCCHVSQPG